MASDEHNRPATPGNDDDENDMLRRFPAVPLAPALPDAPTLDVGLPRHPRTGSAEGPEPGTYGKMAIAATIGSSFILPIIILAVGGYWLDTRLHTAPWLAMTGVVLGLVAGIVSLIRVTNRLSD